MRTGLLTSPVAGHSGFPRVGFKLGRLICLGSNRYQDKPADSYLKLESHFPVNHAARNAFAALAALAMSSMR